MSAADLEQAAGLTLAKRFTAACRAVVEAENALFTQQTNEAAARLVDALAVALVAAAPCIKAAYAHDAKMAGGPRQ